MILKEASSRNPITAALGRKLKPKKWLTPILFFVIVTAVNAAGGAYFYKYAYVPLREDIASYQTSVPGWDKMKLSGRLLTTLRLKTAEPLMNYLDGYGANPETIRVDIKLKHYRKLEYDVSQAIQDGQIRAGKDDYVPATIRHKGKTIKAKMRLKGDALDQINDNKWSFRVKTKGEDMLLGMKIFSLHRPAVRNYIYEWIYHKALKKEGIQALRYQFVRMFLNGKDYGIYAVEEHFDQRLIADNESREGVLFKISERTYYDDVFHYGQDETRSMFDESENFQRSPIEPFLTKKYSESPVLKIQLEKSISLMDGFRRGQLKTHEVFDTDKLARYFALTVLLGAQHGSSYGNIRLYYNPITSLIEPVGFDGEIYFHPDIKFDERNEFYRLIFNDPVFSQKYTSELVRVSQPGYLDALFKGIQADLDAQMEIIHRENPWFIFSKEIFYKHQKLIQKELSPYTAVYTHLNALKPGSIELGVANLLQQFFVIIEGVHCPEGDFLEASQRILLSPKRRQSPLHYETLTLSLPEESSCAGKHSSEMKIAYRILGSSLPRQANIYFWHMPASTLYQDLKRSPNDFRGYKFISLDEKTKQIVLKKGQWQSSTDISIPEGYSIHAQPGFELDLKDKANFISYSPVSLLGTEEMPIRIKSTNGTGQGFTVIGAKGQSRLSHVIFDNLSNPDKSGWILTGAVTFYESPVEINHCKFLNNRSEDSLNLIRSHMIVTSTIFKNTHSDALDGDFVEGRIEDSEFYDLKNDAIDVSGSHVSLRNNFIMNAGDKGISIGEESKADIDNVTIRDSKFGVVSKDESKIEAKNILTENCSYDYAVYQKKGEFGPATLRLNNIRNKNFDFSYILDTDSKIFIEGKSLMANMEKYKFLEKTKL